MKRENLNTALLVVCAILLAACTYKVYSLPSMEQIDERMMYWGQHFGAAFPH